MLSICTKCYINCKNCKVQGWRNSKVQEMTRHIGRFAFATYKACNDFVVDRCNYYIAKQYKRVKNVMYRVISRDMFLIHVW